MLFLLPSNLNLGLSDCQHFPTEHLGLNPFRLRILSKVKHSLPKKTRLTVLSFGPRGHKLA